MSDSKEMVGNQLHASPRRSSNNVSAPRHYGDHKSRRGKDSLVASNSAGGRRSSAEEQRSNPSNGRGGNRRGRGARGRSGGGRGGRGSRRSGRNTHTDLDPSAPPFELSRTAPLVDDDILSKSPNAKKGVSINHLIDFQPRRHDPKSVVHHHGSPGGRKSSRQRTHSYRKSSKHTATYDREKFLQANCQFHVAAGQDYISYLSDPDKFVDWEHVREVVVTTPEARCPICLGVPVAAKITRCGHVYCWHCILHHLANSDCEPSKSHTQLNKNWSNCPICEDYVYAKDLRSVRCRVVSAPTVGKKLRMRLLKRHRGSAMPIVSEDWHLAPNGPQEIFHSEDINKDFFKISPMTLDQLRNVYVREHRQLKAEVDGPFPPDKFVFEALREVDRRLLSLTDGNVDYDSDASSVDGCVGNRRHRTVSASSTGSLSSVASATDGDLSYLSQFPVVNQWAGSANNKIMSHERKIPSDQQETKFSDSEHWSSGDEQATGGVLPPPMSNLHVPTQFGNGNSGQGKDEALPTASPIRTQMRSKDLNDRGPSEYSFFQAADCQSAFIHSINMRCLTHEYGSVDNFPLEIEGKVVALTRETMDEEMRRKYRYLSHLPLRCEFIVCELDLKPLLSPATVSHFAAELNSRRVSRKKRAAMDAKYSRKMRQELEFQQQTFYESQRTTQSIEPEAEVMEWLAARTVGSSDENHSSQKWSSSSGFAAVLGGYGANDPVVDNSQQSFPSLGAGESNSSEHDSRETTQKTTVSQWGAAPPVKLKSQAVKIPEVVASATIDAVEYTPPSHQSSFLAGVDDAFSALSTSPSDNTTAIQSKSGKKGKKKKLVLLSTSSQRRT